MPTTTAIQVGPNVQVSTEDRRTHVEVHLAADPRDPQRLAACSMIEGRPGAGIPGDGGTRTVLYVSPDAGRTWTRAVEDSSLAPAPWGWAPDTSWDPTCEYGREGWLYFGTATHIAGDSASVSRVRLYRSPDGGRTWLAPTIIDGGFRDKPILVVDTRSDSPYRDRLYLTYTSRKAGAKRSMALLAVSTDHGAHFAPAVVASDPGQDMHGGAVLADGTVVLVGEASPNVVISRDGGRTATATRIAAQIPGGCQCMTSVAVDPSTGPFRDRIYVTWGGHSEGRSQIFVAYSADQGHTWSEPRVISDDRPRGPGERGPDDIMAAVAVNRDGVVGVSWYDRRDNPDNIGYYVRFSASLDGGETWLPSVRVSERPNVAMHVLEAQAPLGVSVSLSRYDTASATQNLWITRNQWPTSGHYAGLAAGADGVFHTLWVDNRTGVKQVWTAPIRVGQFPPRPEPMPAGLSDITGQVTLRFEGLAYQRTGSTTALLAGTVNLTNTSADTLRGPLRLRLLEEFSLAGTATPPTMGFDSEFPHALSDQILDLDAGLVDSVLAPGATSKPVPLQIRITDLTVKSDALSAARGQSFHMDARVRILGVVPSSKAAQPSPPSGLSSTVSETGAGGGQE